MKFQEFLLTLCLVSLAACTSGGESPGGSSTRDARSADPFQAVIQQGEAVYVEHCLTCHQADGGGVPFFQPPLVDGLWVTGDPDALIQLVLAGSLKLIKDPAGDYDNVMPSFAALDDNDLAVVLTYIRHKFGDGASPVGPDDIARVRATLPLLP